VRDKGSRQWRYSTVTELEWRRADHVRFAEKNCTLPILVLLDLLLGQEGQDMVSDTRRRVRGTL
jgi:hypothetical protein